MKYPDKTTIYQFARDAGLPISWWTRALESGDDPPCWRELELFAEQIADHTRQQCLKHMDDEYARIKSIRTFNETDSMWASAQKQCLVRAMQKIRDSEDSHGH